VERISLKILNLHTRSFDSFSTNLSAELFITAHVFDVIDVVFPVFFSLFKESKSAFIQYAFQELSNCRFPLQLIVTEIAKSIVFQLKFRISVNLKKKSLMVTEVKCVGVKKVNG